MVFILIVECIWWDKLKKRKSSPLGFFFICVHQHLLWFVSTFLLLKEHVWVTSEGGSGIFDAPPIGWWSSCTSDPRPLKSPSDRYECKIDEPVWSEMLVKAAVQHAILQQQKLFFLKRKKELIRDHKPGLVCDWFLFNLLPKCGGWWQTGSLNIITTVWKRK